MTLLQLFSCLVILLLSPVPLASLNSVVTSTVSPSSYCLKHASYHVYSALSTHSVFTPGLLIGCRWRQMVCFDMIGMYVSHSLLSFFLSWFISLSYLSIPHTLPLFLKHTSTRTRSLSFSFHSFFLYLYMSFLFLYHSCYHFLSLLLDLF